MKETIKKLAVSAGVADPSLLYKSGSLLFSKNIVTSIVALGVAVVAANVLSPATYGTYKYIISLGAVATMFSLSGSGNVLLRSVAKGHQGVFRYLLAKSLIVGYVPSLILSIAAIYYALIGNPLFGQALLIVALFQPIFQAASLYKSYLNGKQLYKELALIVTFEALSTGLGIAIGMYLFDSVLVLIGIYFTVNSVFTLIACTFVYRKFELHAPHIKQETQKEVLSYTKHMSLMNVINKIALDLDSLIAFQFLGPVQLAIYTFAKTPVEQIRGQSKLLRSLVAPRFSDYPAHVIQNSIQRKTLTLFLMTLGCIVLYILIAPFLFSVLFPAYHQAVIYTQILSLSLLNIPSIFFIEALTALKKIKALYLLNTVAPIVKISALIILVPPFGILGLAIAVVIPRLTNVLLAAFMYAKTIKEIP